MMGRRYLVEAYMRRHEQRLEQTRPYYARGVSYIKYMDELAEQIGARPDVPPLPEPWRT